MVNDFRVVLNGREIKAENVVITQKNTTFGVPEIRIQANISYNSFFEAIRKPLGLGSKRYDAALAIKDVIFNPPATIVLWNDGTKTVVKAENEVFDKEKGLAMAICKRTNGNNGRYFEAFKKYCRSEDAPKRVPKRSGRYPWKEAVEALAQENLANINNEPAQLEEKETTTEKD